MKKKVSVRKKARARLINAEAKKSQAVIFLSLSSAVSISFFLEASFSSRVHVGARRKPVGYKEGEEKTMISQFPNSVCSLRRPETVHCVLCTLVN